MKLRESEGRTWRDVAAIAAIVALLPLLIAIAVVMLAAYVVWSAFLHLVIWTWWCLRGRDILVVYSESPIWHDYIEQRILPFLGDRAVVLNWSRRKQWRPALARAAFLHFGGGRQFNPLVVVFRPLRPTKTFRFWQPFRDFKHGRPDALRALEDQVFSLIGVRRPEPPA